MVLVNIWEGYGAAEEAGGYCERWGIEATVLLDETAEYARAAAIRGVPTNVFVDEGGVVRAVGATTTEELLREAHRLEPRLLGTDDESLDADLAPRGFAS